MIHLSQETEALATRLAAAQRLPVEEVIRRALEAQARAAGVQPEPLPVALAQAAKKPHPRRRMTVEQIMALGAEIAALPIIDPRSPNDIMDDVNAL